MSYDTSNIFHQILLEKIPAKKIVETDKSLSFFDIQPARKIHALVIPKGKYITYSDFILKAANEEKNDFFDCIQQTITKLGLGESGYRLITNAYDDGGQEVPHFHFHILGGEKVGKLVVN